MKHKFTKGEIGQIELCGMDLDQLDGLYEILRPYAVATGISMSHAIENVARILKQFKNLPSYNPDSK